MFLSVCLAVDRAVAQPTIYPSAGYWTQPIRNVNILSLVYPSDFLIHTVSVYYLTVANDGHKFLLCVWRCSPLVQRSQVDNGDLFYYFLIFVTQLLSEPRPYQFGYTGRPIRFWDPPVSEPPCLVSPWVLGSELSSCLHREHATYWAISSDPLLTEVSVPPGSLAVLSQTNSERSTLIINWLVY